MAKKFPLHPRNPERICWGCDQYCAADDLRCGNGSDRTQHPVELFGEDWAEWDLGPPEAEAAAPADSDDAVATRRDAASPVAPADGGRGPGS